MSGFQLIGPLAYRGKTDCESATCTRMVSRNEDGTFDLGTCMGWHCSYCDEPCSSQGHRCPVSLTLLAESERILNEGDAA